MILSFVGVFLTIPINKANAYSPQIFWGAEDTSVSGSNVNWNTNFAPAGVTCGSAPVSCNGLIFAITVQSFPYTAITSMTDNVGGTVSTNDTYIKVACTTGGVVTAGECIYYTLVNTVHTPTFLHIIISFATACVVCDIDFTYSNQPMALSNSGAVTPYTRLSALNSANIPKLYSNVLSNTFTFSGSQQYAVLNAIDVNDTSTSVFVNYGVQSPLVTIHSTAPVDGTGSWDIASTSISPSGSSISYQFNVIPQTSSVNDKHFTCNTIYNCTSYYVNMVTAIFVQSTVQPPSCQNCGTVYGGATKATTTFTLNMANETLLYTGDSPAGGNLIQNVTTEVASYTNGGSGKNLDVIFICIYELPSGTLQGNTPISSSNQLKQTTCATITSISTGQTNQFIHWYPNIEVPPSTTFAISIMSRFAGLSLYQDTIDVLTLYGDTADYVLGSGTPPNFISNFFVATPHIYLVATGSQSSLITTATAITQVTVCISGGTCTFTTATVTQQVTQTLTSFMYSLVGTNGAVANIQDLTAFIPVWVLPLVMGGLFGVIGLLFGAILGLGMGSVLGIIPLWMSFLLGLGIVFILFKRVF